MYQYISAKEQLKKKMMDKIYHMELRLAELWKEANRYKSREMKELKLQEYWNLYRDFKRKREFLIAMSMG